MGGQSHAAAVFCLYFAPALTNSTNDKPNSHSVSLVPERESFGHGKVWTELVAGMSPTSPDSAKTQPYTTTTDVDGID